MLIPDIVGKIRQWANKGIQRRLIFWSIGFWVLSISILTLTFLLVGQNQIVDETRQRNVQLASVISRDINAQISSIYSDARIFSRHLELSNPDLESQAAGMLSLRLSSPQRYRAVYYFDSAGKPLLHLTDTLESLLMIKDVNTIVSSPPVLINEEIIATRQMVSDTGTSISDVYFTGLDRLPVVYIGMPVTFSKGDARVVVLEVDLRDIWQRINLSTVGQSGFTYAVSRKGTVIAHPDPARVGSSVPAKIKTLLMGYEGFTNYTDPLSRRAILVAFSPVGGPTGWGIVVEQDEAEVRAYLFRTGIFIIGIWVILAMVGTFGIRLIIKSFTSPIIELTTTTQNIAQTGFLTKTGMVRHPDEIGKLSQAFDQMIGRLQTTEGRLTTSEEKYRSLFENANDAIFIIDETGFIDCNRKSEEMFGTKREQLLHKMPQQLSPETQPDGSKSEEKASLKIGGALSGIPQFFEWKHQKLDGTLFDAEVSLNRIEIEGKPILLAITRDISDRKQTQEMLRQSEEMFRSIVENSHGGIFIVNEVYRFTYANDMLCKILGYPQEEIISNDFREFLDDESKKLVADNYVKRQRGEYVPPRYEFNIVRKDGNKRRVEISSVVIRDAIGKLRTVGQILDVTERRQAEDELHQAHEKLESRVVERTAELREANTQLQQEILQREQVQEALRRNELKYRHLVESANTIILEMDTKGRVTFINKFAEGFFGFRESEILGNNVIGTIVPPRDSSGKDLQFMIDDIGKNPGRYLHNENENMLRNGERVWIVWTNQPLYDEKGHFKEILCIGINRTAQKKAEEILARETKEKATTEERNRLARDLHDAVSQTLFSASLISEVLPRLWERNPDEGRKRLEEVRQLTRGALAEMRTLLLELRPAAIVETELSDLLRQLGESITGRARVPVTVTVEGHRTLSTEAKIALYRIAQEALNNIAKHAGASQAKVNLQCQPGEVLLRVTDNGKGFDKDIKSPESLGMGIMRERAREIGATITIESKVGLGTEVVVAYKKVVGGEKL